MSRGRRKNRFQVVRAKVLKQTKKEYLENKAIWDRFIANFDEMLLIDPEAIDEEVFQAFNESWQKIAADKNKTRKYQFLNPKQFYNHAINRD